MLVLSVMLVSIVSNVCISMRKKKLKKDLNLGATLGWTNIPCREGGRVEILLVASCYRNKDKLLQDGPLGSYADLTFVYFSLLHMSQVAYQAWLL